MRATFKTVVFEMTVVQFLIAGHSVTAISKVAKRSASYIRKIAHRHRALIERKKRCGFNS